MICHSETQFDYKEMELPCCTKWTIELNNPAVALPGEVLQIKNREPTRRQAGNDLPTGEVSL